MFEILNGIMTRPDYEQLKHIPMGGLPAGSGNGILQDVFQLADLYNSFDNALYMIINSRSISININKFTLQGHDETIYSSMMLVWGYHADVDIGSEGLRCLGGQRFIVYGVWRWLCLNRYQCKLMWTDDEEAAANIPPLNQEIDNSDGKWEEYEGGMITYIYQNNQFLGEDMRFGPLNDVQGQNSGLQFVKGNVGRCRLLRDFLSSENGGHVDIPNKKVRNGVQFQYKQCKAMRLIPQGPRVGVYSIDGELFEAAPIQCQNMSNGIRFFCCQQINAEKEI